MDKEQKDKIKETIGSVADELSDKALAEAKEQTNKFWKLLLYIIGVMLAGIAALAGFAGCQNVPSVTLTVEQLQMVEEVYTAAGGEVKYRVVPVVETVKK